MITPKIIYLCGPITGMPNGNKSLFEKAENWYIKRGHQIVNPHNVAYYLGDVPEHVIVKSELASISTIVDGIALLPGWKNSRYGLVEVSVGLACGLTFWVAGTETQTSPTLKLFAYGSQGSKMLVAWDSTPAPAIGRQQAGKKTPSRLRQNMRKAEPLAERIPLQRR